jgi:murein DD-endopeptidase MepM/ murein hydrolase activator NlpD
VIQQRLNDLGYKGENGQSIAVNGVFDSNTVHAVNTFKDANIPGGNKGENRGVVGTTTLKLLFSSAAKPGGQRDGVFPVAGDAWHWESAYGDRYNSVTKTTSEHRGIDIWAPQGTDLYAMYDGKVTKVNEIADDTFGYYVHIESVVNGQAITYEYLHMYKQAIVKVGEVVSAGDKVGEVGKTGAVRGENPSHLHVNVKINNAYVNPNPNFERPSTTESKYNYESSEFSYIPLK